LIASDSKAVILGKYQKTIQKLNKLAFYEFKARY